VIGFSRVRWFCTVCFGALLSGFLWTTPGYSQLSRVRSTGDGHYLPDRADSLFLQGRIEEAFQEYARLKLPDSLLSPSAMHNRGLLERLTGRGSGLVWFRKAYDLNPSGYHVPYALGTALTDEGLLIEGERYLNIAVKLDHEYYESSVELGRNLRLQQRYEEALRAIRKAFGRDRTYVPAYIEQARTLIAMRRNEEAREVLLAGYRKFPYAIILLELTELEIDLGHVDEALKYAREFLTQYPKHEERDRMLSLVQQWQPDALASFPDQYVSTHLDYGKPWFPPERVLPAGLQLNYNVRWGILPIGRLQIDVIEGEFQGEPAWEARYIASSLPGLPFITIADTFYAWIDRDLRHVPLLEMRYNEMGYEAIKTYRSDYETGWFHEYSRLGNGYWEHTSHPLPPHVFDASSQLWVAQQFVLMRRGGNAIVELSGGFEKTVINYRGAGPLTRVDGERVETIALDGIMRYAGIAGMTGDFQGLYTADERAWPILAKFKIFLGWVTIEYQSQRPSELTPGFGMFR